MRSQGRDGICTDTAYVAKKSSSFQKPTRVDSEIFISQRDTNSLKSKSEFGRGKPCVPVRIKYGFIERAA